jgi:hypothetical protein
VTSATPYGPPTAPRHLKAKAKKTAITVTWSAPASTGGKAVTAYLVDYATCPLGRHSCHHKTKKVSGHTHRTKLTGLKPKTRYEVAVAATNTAGNSPTSTIKKISTKR